MPKLSYIVSNVLSTSLQVTLFYSPAPGTEISEAAPPSVPEPATVIARLLLDELVSLVLLCFSCKVTFGGSSACVLLL